MPLLALYNVWLFLHATHFAYGKDGTITHVNGKNI